MATNPKCTSWLGHNYQPRYDRGPAQIQGMQLEVTRPAMAVILDRTRQVTYVCDVCERCGHVIERGAK